ncbi:WSC domain-containing protein [Fusarium sp. Ph1]|nr:WSC domain-containing protein [Fusarium sp. Ph1]
MKSVGILTLWASLVHYCLGFGVTESGDANTLANAIFSGPGITIIQASFSGASVSSGTFTDGPFGIGSGAILTSGAAVGALPGGDHYVNNGAPGSDTYCGTNTFNAAILTVDVLVQPGYAGIDFEYILASEEEGGSPDPIGIFVGGTQYAVDENGDRMTATNEWISPNGGLVIVPPNSVTSYPGSSPPFLQSVLATGAQTVVIAICDFSDTEWDSGLLIKAGGCVDCDTDFRLAYVTTTVTTTTTGTSTQTASGTVSGTIFVSVLAETTTTTAEETTTTTAAETTTTTAETTTAETTTTTEMTTTMETKTTTAETTTETTTAETTTTTAETTTTAAETTTTAAETTTTVETTTTTETTTTEETTTTAETTTETTTSEEPTITTTEVTTTTEESTATTEESTATTEETSTTLETTTETTTSVDTTTETSTKLTTTETTTELPTTSDEATSTEESNTKTTSAQLTETTTGLTTQPTTSTELPTTSIELPTTSTGLSTTALTSTESSTTDIQSSTPLQSSEIWSNQPSDTTSQFSTTSIESTSITPDSSSVWSTEPSYTTTQESTLEITSTQTSSIILQPSSDEPSSTETISSTNAELPTVISLESSTTESTQPPPTTSAGPSPSSTETSPATSTQLLPAMSTETSTTGTEESTSEAIPPESSSLEPPIPTLEPTTSDSMFTVLPTPTPPSESTTSTEPIDASSAETPSPEPSVSETVTTVAPLPPSASTASGTSTEAVAASNLPSIKGYEFIGCLGSRQGYPTFEELLTDPEMTTARCIELAAGRKYVGLYLRSCYAADELTNTGLVQDGQCNLPCPGDPGLFCGGNVVNRRRAVSADRLLTLYGLTQALDSSSIEVVSSTSEPLIPSSLPPSLSPTSTVDIVPSLNPSSIEIPSSIPPSDETSVNNLPIPFPTQGPSPPKGYTFNVTQTIEATYANTVTTVVYQTINPQDPEYLTVTEVVVTLGYYPCGRCAAQPIPPVEMTTIVQPCNACGWQGANSVTLTIPKAACTPAAGHEAANRPNAWPRPVPHKTAGGVIWGPAAKATEPASRPRPDHGTRPGNQYSPPAGNDRYPAEHDQPRPTRPHQAPRPPVQQRPVVTHQAQPAMPKKPAPDASLPPPSPAKAEPINPEVPADSEPTQPEHYVWDDQDENDSPQPPAIHTQAAPKPVGGSDNSNPPAENHPWGPPTEPIVVVAKGAVNGINGFMMAVLLLLVTFY